MELRKARRVAAKARNAAYVWSGQLRSAMWCQELQSARSTAKK